VNPDGTLAYCGYIGGEGNDRGMGIAVDGAGNAYIAGTTFSREPTFPALVGPDVTANGAWPNDEEAFVAKISAFDIPAPAAGSVSPASATAGDPPLAMSIGGTGFERGAVVMWDGRDLPTTFLSGQELRAEVGADVLQIVGIVAVTVRNPNGGVSNAVPFTVNNALPVLTSISPAQAVVGSSWFNLALYGSGFVPGSVAQWDGQPRDTTYVSSTELQAAIAAEDIDTAGRIPVTVLNPEPGGGPSGPADFSVITFAVEGSPASAAVTAGASASYTIRVTPQYGPFDSAVSFNYGTLPKGCTGSFSPITVTPGAGAVSTTLTLRTTARKNAGTGAALGGSALIPPGLGLLILILAVVLPSFFVRPRPARRYRRWAHAAICAGLIVSIAGCSAGGGSPQQDNGTPIGDYQITVQAVSGNIRMSTAMLLIVR
jgi:hypothetical protein